MQFLQIDAQYSFQKKLSLTEASTIGDKYGELIFKT